MIDSIMMYLLVAAAASLKLEIKIEVIFHGG
jgi:hypothetical protein